METKLKRTSACPGLIHLDEEKWRCCAGRDGQLLGTGELNED
jgi:hypothetical protein